MDQSFWRARWQEGRIGFHEGRPNTYLERHASRLDGCARVLVPLCGKAEDLAFLAGRGHEVIGVELVEDAVRAFFAEHGATPEIRARGSLTEYTAGTITLLAGDVFAVTPEHVGHVDALYDRAALIALPPEMRARYVPHVRKLLAPGARGLLVTLEYAQQLAEGPPFAVLEDEVRALWAHASVELVDEGPDPRVREGMPPAVERCFALRLPS